MDELLRQTSIWQQPTLRIGVAANEPLMGEIKDGVRSGFDVELARYLARSLGYTDESDVEFVTVRTDERIRFLLAGHVDIVVASLSYTEERAKLIGMAGPYFVTNQAFLVPKASAATLRTEDDFKEKKVKVCTSGSSTTEDELTRRGFDRSVVQDLQDCADGVRSGKYGAMSSDKTILAGYYSQHPQDLSYVQLPFGADERLHVACRSTTGRCATDRVLPEEELRRGARDRREPVADGLQQHARRVVPRRRRRHQPAGAARRTGPGGS